MVIPRRTDRPRLHALLHAVRPGAAAQVEDAGDAVVEEQLPLVPVVVNVRVDQARNDVLSSRIDHGDSGRYRLPPLVSTPDTFDDSILDEDARVLSGRCAGSIDEGSALDEYRLGKRLRASARKSHGRYRSKRLQRRSLSPCYRTHYFVLLGSGFPRSHIVATPSSATLCWQL